MTEIDGFDLIAPQAYGDRGVPHDQWRALRKLDRLHRCAPEGFDAFYPVVRHDQICEISKQPERFLNRLGIVLESREQKRILEANQGIGQMRAILVMDPPEHRDYRKVAAPWFTPRAIDRIAPIAEESARALVDGLVERASGGEGECEFANEIAAAHPLRVLSHDPRRAARAGAPASPSSRTSSSPRTIPTSSARARIGVRRCWRWRWSSSSSSTRSSKTAARTRRTISRAVLANGKVNGEPMGMMETLGYYLITFTAGHDTTKNALAGGIHALAEHPAEFEKLKRNPELVPSAVEEILRWTSPVNYMKRVVAEDLEFRGQKLREGENLVLFYASANRDESVFEDPYTFRIDRDPNPHLAFGIGEHFCLGAHLARQSQRALLRELVRRIDALELAGDPVQIASSFVVGLKRLPIRYRLSRAAAS